MSGLVVLVVVSGVLHIVQKVLTGHGLDYYFTGQGVRFNYMGALITLAVAAVAVLVGLGVRFFGAKPQETKKRRRDEWRRQSGDDPLDW
jgi:hypothetical protein